MMLAITRLVGVRYQLTNGTVVGEVDAAIAPVRNPDTVLMINSDAAGQPEFAGVPAFSAERQQQTPRAIENLHVLEL